MRPRSLLRVPGPVLGGSGFQAATQVGKSVRSGDDTDLPVALLDQARHLPRQLDWLPELVSLALLPAALRLIGAQGEALAAELPEGLGLADGHDGTSGHLVPGWRGLGLCVAGVQHTLP